MSDEFVLGMDAVIYQGPADAAIGSLTEMDNVKDATVNLSAGEADVTTRANSGWRATAATLRECTIDFEMLWKPGDAGFEAIKTSFLTSTPLALAALTGARETADSEGPLGNFSITNFSRSEPLEEGVSVSVTAKMAKYAQWIDV